MTQPDIKTEKDKSNILNWKETVFLPSANVSIPLGSSPSRSSMTHPMVHTGAHFAPGVGFSLFQQAELQAALAAVFPPPLLGFQIPGRLEVLYRPLHGGSGEGELPGNGTQCRPADPLGVGPVTEVEVDCLGPVGQLLVLINRCLPSKAFSLRFLLSD